MMSDETPPAVETYEAPAILTQDAILFPEMEVNMSMHEPRSVAAALQALQEHNLVVLVPSPDVDSAVGSIGTLALVRTVPSQGAGAQSLWKGLWRVKVDKVLSGEPYVRVRFSRAGELHDIQPGRTPMMKAVFAQIDEFMRVIPGIPSGIIEFLKSVDTPGKLADLCAYSPFFSRQDRLDLLKTLDPEERLAKVSRLFDAQLAGLKKVSRSTTIPECSTCIELADKAFELGPSRGAEVAAEFLTHVIREHPDEVLGLLAERYGPGFMRRRSLK
jgi:ATP-dependent Lon protease